MVALPYTITNGTTGDASQVQTNFTTLRDALSNIKNSDIATTAAIDKSKLAQTFQVDHLGPFPLVPAQSGSVLAVSGTTAVFTINQTAMTEIYKNRVKYRSGQIVYLCAVEWHVQRKQSVSGTPQLDVTVDGVQLLGQVQSIDTSDAYYLAANSNPIDNPLMPITSDSVFIWRVGAATAVAADVTLAGVTVTVTVKSEVVP